ncbi:hypothetical protein DYU11_03460 [Fibrisoma montanum]|uniref:Uncharacterized protein n=1 Tax=Fibrisoma montanum TaxID=2305895 RepID=A0A418MIY8_9BACT|nr:hypothetical protein [Fibrisoma montanum]RIV27382.1 hypothetical protein DYU11_03460 [Fibrisoma montanum]
MNLQTTQYDQLVNLFNCWSYTGLLSFAAYETQLKKLPGEDARLAVSRETMHFFYETRQQLQDCLTGLSKEVEANMLTIGRDQHDIIYLNKLANTYNQITEYLNNEFGRQIDSFDGLLFDIEPPKKPIIGEYRDIGGFQAAIMDEAVDPYWNEYVTEEQYIVDAADTPPVLIRLIKSITEGFAFGAAVLYQAITKSIVYKNHPDLITLLPSDTHKITVQNQQSSKPYVKLRWTGTNRSLYELFAQLSFIQVKPGKPLLDHSINELAEFLSACVEGLPQAETVERELEKMREDDGISNSVRGRINLHITRD